MKHRIIRLEAQNVKRLKAVTITPEGEMVVVGGNNGAGKSSVLDSIQYALAGKRSMPAEVVRRGQSKATVRVDLGDLIVERTMRPGGGGSLKVTTPEGITPKSPQAVLDRLAGQAPIVAASFGARRELAAHFGKRQGRPRDRCA